jgi:hypothetical protein
MRAVIPFSPRIELKKEQTPTAPRDQRGKRLPIADRAYRQQR